MKNVLIILIPSITSTFLFAKLPPIIEGTVVNNTEPVLWLGVIVPKNVPASLTYRNNSVTS